MQAFNRIIRAGTAKDYRNRTYSVFVNVKFDGSRLSITGVEGPTRDGNAIGGCGQIADALTAEGFAPLPGVDARKLAEVWNRWHLNDMRAGSPAQEEYLRTHPVAFKYPESHYTKACEALAAAGLNPDAGYRYGSAWKFEAVPEDVLQWLAALPETDITPAWI